MRSALHRLRRGTRSRLLALAAPLAPSGEAPLPDLSALERVLVVFANFRLGNTVLATAGVSALAEAFPKMVLDFLGGCTAPAVMHGHRLRRVLTVSRGDVLAPGRLWRLVASLRRERYQAALHLSPATSSLGAFLVGVSGAEHRLGCRRAQGNVYFTTTVEPPRARHKIDQMTEYLGRLGVPRVGQPRLVLGAEEVAWAEEALAPELEVGELVAVFVGARARKGKSWPLATAGEVLGRLRTAGLRPLVFLGPEESPRERQIRAALGQVYYVREPDLRRMAALVSHCVAAVTPDAGPMHLAMAVGVPTVAVFRRSDADKWGPRMPHGLALVDPIGGEVHDVAAAVLRLAAAGRG